MNIRATRTNNFWTGFATGAAAGAAAGIGSALLWRSAWQSGDKRVLRMESSIQIGRPVNEVFSAWLRLHELARYSPLIRSIAPLGRNRSRWTVQFDGRSIEWDAEIEQLVPNESIGWKSIRGPKHSGRIIFSPLRDETVVQVRMNYVPPVGIFNRVIGRAADMIHAAIEQALRDVKAGLERGRALELEPTGTSGEIRRPAQMQYSRFGGPPSYEMSKPVPPAPFGSPDAKK